METLRNGTKSVESYYKKMLLLLEGLEEIVHVAIKIEWQLQRKSSKYTKSKSNFNAITLVEKVSLSTIPAEKGERSSK